MFKVVAIIPARGGSKGIHRKNLSLFCNKPLIQYSIEAALSATKIDDVYVSTEDTEIAAISKKLHAEIINRPKELAKDDTPTFPVLRHAAEVLNFPDVIVTLQPTSPLRTAKHIDEALSLLNDDIESVVGVSSVHRYFWSLENGFGKPNFYLRLPRQKMPKQYIENGSIYVTRKSVIMRNDYKLGMGISSKGKVKLYEMEDIHSIEIDTVFDLKLLEYVYKQLNKENIHE